MRLLREPSSERPRASVRALLPAVGTLALLLAGLAGLGAALDSVTSADTVGWTALASVAQLALYAVVIAAGIWLAGALEHRTHGDFGLSVDSAWLAEFAAGVAITLFGVAASLWWADTRGLRDVALATPEFHGPNAPLALAVVLALFACYFLLGNVYEELVYRRIVLGNLVEGLVERGMPRSVSVVGATFASLALFGAYHVPLRGNVVVALDAAIDGVPFALAYLLTGRLALAVGVHFGRILVEFLHGLTLGPFEVVAAVELTRNTLSANLELKTVRVGLLCLGVLAWVYATRGELALRYPGRE